MHLEILNEEQKELLPMIKQFRREFYLVGGTAIALQIGHRRSIDYDLFKRNPFQSKRILEKIETYNYKYLITRNVKDQLNLIVNGVKITFFEYPYPIESNLDFGGIIRLPDLLTLAAMKAYALGRRAKWKDYVDLYFILKSHHTLNEIVQKANDIFDQEFSEKMFRAQLAYHNDIDYSEAVEFLPGFETGEDEMKAFLIDKSLEINF